MRDAGTFVCKVPRKGGRGVGARRRGRNGEPRFIAICLTTLDPGKIIPIRSSFRGAGRGGGGRDGIAALSIIAGEKLRSLKAPLLSSRVLKFMYSGLLDR